MFNLITKHYKVSYKYNAEFNMHSFIIITEDKEPEVFQHTSIDKLFFGLHTTKGFSHNQFEQCITHPNEVTKVTTCSNSNSLLDGFIRIDNPNFKDNICFDLYCLLHWGANNFGGDFPDSDAIVEELAAVIHQLTKEDKEKLLRLI